MRRPIAAWINTVRTSRTARSAGTLVGGTAAAQAVTLLALPVLTRLYSPADFSVLAVYSALLLMISIPATGRFDMAIPLAEREEQAANLLVLTLVCSACTALSVALLLLAFGGSLVRAASIEEVAPYLWLLPISIFLASSFIGIQRWWLRRKAFRMIAVTRLNQTLTGVGVQLALGFLGFKPIGLLVGHLMIAGAGSVKLTREFFRRDRQLLSGISPRSLRQTARDFIQFPRYSIVDSFASGAGNQVPLIVIAAVSAGPQAGLLLLTMRVLGAPVQLLAGAVAQVYHSEVGEARHEGRLQQSTEKLVQALMLYGAAPLLFGSLAAAPLFGIVFGEQWRDAGVMLMWVAPWYALRLVVSPLLSLPAAVGKQRLIMFARLATLLFRVAAVYVGFYLWDGRAVEALAIASIGHWLLLMALFFGMARVRVRQLGLRFVAVPVAAGLSGLLVAQLISSIAL